MGTSITITAQFDSVEAAAEFMGRAGGVAAPAITEAAKTPRGSKKADATPLPVTTPAAATAAAAGAPQPAAPGEPKAQPTPASPVPGPGAAAPDAAAIALVMPTATPTPQAAAPKEPNKPVQAVANAAAPKQSVTLHPATQDGVRAALKEVFNLRGATVATQLLQKHGAVSVSTVAKEKFDAFVKDAAAS